MPWWYKTWQRSGYSPTHANKTSQETQKSLMKFLEPTRKPKVSYTDNSLEFGKSCEQLSWHHCTSTPHRSETNGIAERAVRRLKEATSAVLLQSGLDEKWWAESMECNWYLRNIQDLLSDGRTPYERRFGIPFNGPVTPFGAMVEYHPISAKDQSRLHRFGPEVLPGIFLGSVLYAGESGKETLWLQTLKMDASHKAQCKGSVNATDKWKLHFLVRRWNSTNLWVRTASENIHLNPGASGTRRRFRNS